MENKKSLIAVSGSSFGARFRKPLYDSYNFSRIPNTIARCLGAQSEHPLPLDVLPDGGVFSKVIFVLVDAFGWRSYRRFISEKLSVHLAKLAERSVVSMLTSQFPSTTAAHVTTLMTGKPVGMTAVYEWTMFLPEAERLIHPLPFSTPENPQADSLAALGVSAEALLPAGETFFERLGTAGVASTVVHPWAYSRSSYNRAVTKGARLLAYSNAREGAGKLREAIIIDKGPHYYYFYYPDFDAAAHEYGVESEIAERKACEFFQLLDEELLSRIGKQKEPILLLLSADHGQVEINPATTIYIDKILPEIRSMLTTVPSGAPIVPAGSSRDFFLHIKPDCVDDACALLQPRLAGVAEVHRVRDLIEAGFFGAVSPKFLERVGSVVVLPYEGQSVFWCGEHDEFSEKFLGHHGGLTPAEVEIPFFATVIP